MHGEIQWISYVIWNHFPRFDHNCFESNTFSVLECHVLHNYYMQWNARLRLWIGNDVDIIYLEVLDCMNSFNYVYAHINT